MRYRDIEQRLSWSRYRESVAGAAAYGDAGALAGAALDQSAEAEELRAEATPEHWLADTIQGAEGYPSDAEIDWWDSGVRLQGPADTALLGMLLMIALGAPATTTPSGATDTRDHLYTPQSLADPQLPSTSLATLQAGAWSRWPGLVCEELVIEGGRSAYTLVRAKLRGNGRREALGGYSPPAYSTPRRLRDALGTLLLGAPGSPAAVTTRLERWGLTVRNRLLDVTELAVDDLIPYDAAHPDRGYVAGALELDGAALRSAEIELVLVAQDWAEWSDCAELTAREVAITAEGDEIEAGFHDRLTVAMADARLTAVEPRSEGGLQHVRLRATPLHSGALADVLAVTLRNGVAAYGLLQT